MPAGWLGETMSGLCREFGISRKTGYKIIDGYQQCGVQGLTNRSRRPYRYAHQLPFQVENHILNVKHEHPSWGARRIRERLLRRFTDIKLPELLRLKVVTYVADTFRPMCPGQTSNLLVGAIGFEPTTPCAQGRIVTELTVGFESGRLQ